MTTRGKPRGIGPKRELKKYILLHQIQQQYLAVFFKDAARLNRNSECIPRSLLRG